MRGRIRASGMKRALACALEDGLNTVGDRVIVEVGDAEQAFGGFENVSGKYLKFGFRLQPNRGKINTGNTSMARLLMLS